MKVFKSSVPVFMLMMAISSAYAQNNYGTTTTTNQSGSTSITTDQTGTVTNTVGNPNNAVTGGTINTTTGSQVTTPTPSVKSGTVTTTNPTTPTTGTVSTTQNVAVTNDQLTTSVKNRIAADRTVSGLNVNVTANNGVVVLSGNVNTDTEASQLIEVVSSVPGVTDTDTTNLVVKDSNQTFTDAAITAKVKGTFVREKLFGDKDISVMSINVDTKDGVVYLTGTVDTQDQADNAVRLAKMVSGVKNVESSLEVKPSA